MFDIGLKHQISIVHSFRSKAKKNRKNRRRKRAMTMRKVSPLKRIQLLKIRRKRLRIIAKRKYLIRVGTSRI